MIAHSRELKHCIEGGVVAGIIGGAVISVLVLVMNLLANQDVWIGTKFAGAPFLGERAMQPGFDFVAVGIGLASHFLVSIAWAVPFALLVFGLTKNATVLAGALWGIVVWLGMFYVVMPAVGLGSAARGVPVMMAVLEHVLFGVAVALGFLPYQRPMSRRFHPVG